MSLFLSYCFFFQTKKDLVLVKFYCNAAGWHSLKTFRKFAVKRLWWKPFLIKFSIFKMDSATAVFLSVFRTLFYSFSQTLNKNAFLWMITLFGAKAPESPKICLKVVAFSYNVLILRHETFSFSLRANFTHFLKNIPLKKKAVNLERLLCKGKSSQNFLKSLV